MPTEPNDLPDDLPSDDLPSDDLPSADLPSKPVESTSSESASSQLNNADAQIQAHRQAHQQKLKKIILIVGIIAAVSIAIFAISSLFGKSDDTVDNNNATAVDALSEQQVAQYREQFKLALTQFEISIQANIDAMALADWRSAEVGSLGLLKEQVLTTFAKGAYAESKSKLDKLYADSNQLIEAWQSEVSQHLATAQEMFAEGNIPQAQLALNKALALQSMNEEGEALQNRIYAFSEIEGLLDDLKVAKVERNLRKQIAVLSDIIVLDPQRKALDQDLQQAKSDYDKQQLADALDAAQKAISAGQLSKAQQFIKQAKLIKPSSKGAAALQAKIDALRSQQSLSQTKQQLATLVQNDNWQAVANLVQQAKKSYPADASLSAYESKASSVLSAKRSIAIFVSKPERMADQNIRDAAQNAIQNAISASINSPSLQADIMQVANALDTYANPVDVTIKSDGDSYIIVIGVGHVGKHDEKVIQLTPGKYTLEARRDGYRNNRIAFIVEANTPISVTLTNDQKL